MFLLSKMISGMSEAHIHIMKLKNSSFQNPKIIFNILWSGCTTTLTPVKLDATPLHISTTLSFQGSVRQLDGIHFESGKWERHFIQTHYDWTDVSLGTFQNQQSLPGQPLTVTAVSRESAEDTGAATSHTQHVSISHAAVVSGCWMHRADRSFPSRNLSWGGSPCVVVETGAELALVSPRATCAEINAHDHLSTKWCMLDSTESLQPHVYSIALLWHVMNQPAFLDKKISLGVYLCVCVCVCVCECM